MADSTLTRDQALTLIRRLGSDEEFRVLFASKPAKALLDIGVPAGTIVDLDAKCLCPMPLASMASFKEASDKMDESVLTATTSMQTPKMSISR